MTDELTVQRRLTAVAYAQQQAIAAGVVCPVCTLQIAKQIDTFLVEGTVPDHPEDDQPNLSDDNVVSLDPRKKH